LKRLIKIFNLPGLLIIDTIISLFAAYAGMFIRFDGNIPQQYYEYIPVFWLMSALILIVAGIITGCYFNVWERAGISEMVRQIVAVTATYTSVYFINSTMEMQIPRGSILIAMFICMFGTVGMRLSVRISIWGLSHLKHSQPEKISRILIVGAGQAGTFLANHLFASKDGRTPIGFIDDKVELWNRWINGLPVFGGRECLRTVLKQQRVDEVIIAVEKADKAFIRDIFEKCQSMKVRLRRYETLHVIDERDLSKVTIRDVDVEELLGRDPVQLNMDAVKSYIEGMTVLVTGGAGSIGSEICRQVMEYGCKKLIIFDFSENGLFEIDNEISARYGKDRHEPVLGSIREQYRLDEVFSKFKPEVVFHAAAHKHVPMMELNPIEAIKNNVFGTLNVARTADKHNVKKFILISTDKAVNPPNIMGASKRIAELCIQMINVTSKTEFAAVRFGNVLGSTGSVVPFFKNQIANGGPITVTHPEIKRYFMTIPEAVQLVLQAGAMAKGGEIFVLDMGEPVKIVDLARTLIQLSGLEPDKDIKIEFTGLRPGEKLFEEINLSEEEVSKTENNKIFVLKQGEHNYIKITHQIETLKRQLSSSNTRAAFQTVHDMVPTYQLKPETDDMQVIMADPVTNKLVP
jgi:FlaA1/EpsC-like NDP-sugar epimerase